MSGGSTLTSSGVKLWIHPDGSDAGTARDWSVRLENLRGLAGTPASSSQLSFVTVRPPPVVLKNGALYNSEKISLTFGGGKHIVLLLTKFISGW